MTERTFRGLVLAGGAAFIALGLAGRFSYAIDPPPMPKKPLIRPPEPLATLDYSLNMYRAALEADSRHYGVTVTTVADVAGVMAYDKEEPHARPPLETKHLRISTRVAPVGGSFQGGTVTTDHIILRIENKTDRWLAYRVDTTPEAGLQRCNDKADISHNALGLAPGQAVERTECVARGGVDGVTVDKVETVVVPPLSYYYVSRLFPPHIGEDARATRGHTPPKARVCANIPEQAIRRGMEKGDVSWRDVVDFYARHDCERFLFPLGYHAFRRPSERPLPVPP